MQKISGFVPLAGKVRSVAGRSSAAKAGLFLLMAYLFLWVPDLDLLLLDLLHHRSIVTHSVLPALLLILLGWRAGAAPIAGALVGIAVHLSCDLLSPMVGYGQIWLPEPYQIPLGPFSYLWLGTNALLAFIWARRLAVRSLPDPYGSLLVAATGTITAVTYGWVNEEAVSAVIVTMAIFLLSYVGPFLSSRRRVKKDRQAKWEDG
ncbi:hypothetical protein PSM7751_03885 [Pseudooceanicola marinus]|uniref:Inner membrane protein n=1 Tax=Pseudooceanicola marinus TaxID=396013 RepID=A0A1X7A6L2_9RHOB|nr:hypothetical protein [Pseudooceanicola marinus]PJE33691.1 hypothetical protein CVM50_00250 [Pseudooceanicola marinus]SLN71895.1 hypothetical protein PSM7751_03885 [Pseudooceanicola marinus]